MPLRSLLLLIFWVSLYYAPLLVLLWRRRSDPRRGPRPVFIFLLLTFTGWMIVGWFAAWYLVLPETVGNSPAPARPDTPETTMWPKHACSQCQGTGRMTCPVCNGMGQQTDCQSCLRSGKVQCTAVHGL